MAKPKSIVLKSATALLTSVFTAALTFGFGYATVGLFKAMFVESWVNLFWIVPSLILTVSGTAILVLITVASTYESIQTLRGKGAGA